MAATGNIRCRAATFLRPARPRAATPVAVGSPPAQFVETVRLEAARTLISEEMPLKTIAAKVGLTPIRLNRAFEPQFGVAPRLFRDMHRKAA
jgi:transcriptional regulator GlxA family with amidase domain